MRILRKLLVVALAFSSICFVSASPVSAATKTATGKATLIDKDNNLCVRYEFQTRVNYTTRLHRNSGKSYISYFENIRVEMAKTDARYFKLKKGLCDESKPYLGIQSVDMGVQFASGCSWSFNNVSLSIPFGVSIGTGSDCANGENLTNVSSGAPIISDPRNKRVKNFSSLSNQIGGRSLDPIIESLMQPQKPKSEVCLKMKLQIKLILPGSGVTEPPLLVSACLKPAWPSMPKNENGNSVLK